MGPSMGHRWLMDELYVLRIFGTALPGIQLISVPTGRLLRSFFSTMVGCGVKVFPGDWKFPQRQRIRFNILMVCSLKIYTLVC